MTENSESKPTDGKTEASPDIVDQLWRDVRTYLDKGEVERATTALTAAERLSDERRRREKRDGQIALDQAASAARQKRFESQQTLSARERSFDRAYRLATLSLAVLALVFVATQVIRRGPPEGAPVNNEAVGALVAQVDRLIQIALTGRQVPTQTSWPIGLTVVIVVAVALAIGAAVWSIFQSKESDGLSKVLAAAILAIGGLFAVAKINDGSSLSADWGDVAVGGLLAILACVALATLPPLKPPVDEHGNQLAVSHDYWRFRSRTGTALIALCMIGLLMIVWGRFRTHYATADVPEKKAGELPPPDSRPPPPPPTPLPKPPAGSDSVAMTPLTEVGLFPAGVASPIGDQCAAVSDRQLAALQRSLDDAIAKVAAARSDKKGDLLLLVASFDRAALRRKCLTTFNTNRELATARARWVIQGLRNARVAADTVSIVVSGPTEFTGDPSVDRAVAIYRFVTVRTE